MDNNSRFFKVWLRYFYNNICYIANCTRVCMVNKKVGMQVKERRIVRIPAPLLLNINDLIVLFPIPSSYPFRVHLNLFPSENSFRKRREKINSRLQLYFFLECSALSRFEEGFRGAGSTRLARITTGWRAEGVSDAVNAKCFRYVCSVARCTPPSGSVGGSLKILGTTRVSVMRVACISHTTQKRRQQVGKRRG